MAAADSSNRVYFLQQAKSRSFTISEIVSEFSVSRVTAYDWAKRSCMKRIDGSYPHEYTHIDNIGETGAPRVVSSGDVDMDKYIPKSVVEHEYLPKSEVDKDYIKLFKVTDAQKDLALSNLMNGKPLIISEMIQKIVTAEDSDRVFSLLLSYAQLATHYYNNKIKDN